MKSIALEGYRICGNFSKKISSIKVLYADWMRANEMSSSVYLPSLIAKKKLGTVFQVLKAKTVSVTHLEKLSDTVYINLSN